MKMKLIYIANARIPTERAHGIQIMQMCRAFSNEGIELELVVPRRLNSIKQDPFSYYGIQRNFKIRKLPCLDLIPFYKYLGHFGLWLESLTFFFPVLFYIIFKKADIIYTRDKLLLPMAFFKKNLIFEAHTFPKNHFLYTPFFKRLTGIVVITQKLKDLFVVRGVEAGKILVAPDGVDIEKFEIRNSKLEIRKKLGLPQDKKIVLYTGHMYEWKGAQTLAAASRHLPENVEIYFVGGMPEDINKFKISACAQVSADKQNLKIKIVGHRPYAEIPYWLKAADVLCLPNSAREEISRHWTSPLKMFEYMAAEKPIIASDLPSIREILNDQNAVLVEPDNAESLAHGIKEVLQNYQLSDKISFRAFKDVKSYSWQIRVKNICQKIF